MSLFRKQRPQTRTSKPQPPALHLETLESRALPTYFSVTQMPVFYTLEQATAGVRIRQDRGPMADVVVAAAAQPVGMGYQSGYFNSDGSVANALRIDTAPGPGQRLGDRVKIAFSYTWTAGLQTNEGPDMPPWESSVTASVSVTAGNVNDNLFNDFLSSNFIFSERDGWTARLVIPMTVGESVSVGVSLNGEAHCAEPHYQTWVDFQAEFAVQDAARGAVLLRDDSATVSALAIGPAAADAVFARREAGLSWTDHRRPISGSSGRLPVSDQGARLPSGDALPWTAKKTEAAHGQWLISIVPGADDTPDDL